MHFLSPSYPMTFIGRFTPSPPPHAETTPTLNNFQLLGKQQQKMIVKVVLNHHFIIYCIRIKLFFQQK